MLMRSARSAFALLMLVASAAAFAAPRGRCGLTRLDAFGGKKASPPAQPEKKSAKDSAWDLYTAGEYGEAFRFPWESTVESSEKTAIGHVLPIVVTTAMIGYARWNAGL